MKLTSIAAIYILFWSLSVFLVLPFGVRTHEEAGVERMPGTAESAPHVFRPGRAARNVTIVATILFGLFYLNYVEGWVSPEAFDFFTMPKS